MPGLVLQVLKGCIVLVVLEEVFKVGEPIFALSGSRGFDPS